MNSLNKYLDINNIYKAILHSAKFVTAQERKSS